MLAKYLAAETAVLEGNDVSFGDRRLSMANLIADPKSSIGRECLPDIIQSAARRLA